MLNAGPGPAWCWTILWLSLQLHSPSLFPLSSCLFLLHPDWYLWLSQPGPARRDGILCPFLSTVCNSWTLSQMSVIFHSFRLPPFFLHKFLHRHSCCSPQLLLTPECL